jgi:hypothetical protein
MTMLLWTVFNEIEVLIVVVIVLTGMLFVLMCLLYGEVRAMRHESVGARPHPNGSLGAHA